MQDNEKTIFWSRYEMSVSDAGLYHVYVKIAEFATTVMALSFSMDFSMKTKEVKIPIEFERP